MKTLTIELTDEVYHRLEVLAARDDDRIKEGVERFLTELVNSFEEKRMPTVVYVENHKTVIRKFGEA